MRPSSGFATYYALHGECVVARDTIAALNLVSVVVRDAGRRLVLADVVNHRVHDDLHVDHFESGEFATRLTLRADGKRFEFTITGRPGDLEPLEPGHSRLNVPDCIRRTLRAAAFARRHLRAAVDSNGTDCRDAVTARAACLPEGDITIALPTPWSPSTAFNGFLDIRHVDAWNRLDDPHATAVVVTTKTDGDDRFNIQIGQSFENLDVSRISAVDLMRTFARRAKRARTPSDSTPKDTDLR